MKKEFEAAPAYTNGLTRSTEAAYWPSNDVDPDKNAVGYVTKILN